MSSKQDIIYGMGLIILALQVTGISSTQWSVDTKDFDDLRKNYGLTKLDTELGLWKGCINASGDLGKVLHQDVVKGKADIDMCLHLPPDDNKVFDKFPKNSLEAVRAFALMGALFVFLGLMCMMYMKVWKRCPMVFLLLGGICSLVANIIWGVEFRKLNIGAVDRKLRPGYSFYVNMAGGIVALMAAGYYYYGN